MVVDNYIFYYHRHSSRIVIIENCCIRRNGRKKQNAKHKKWLFFFQRNLKCYLLKCLFFVCWKNSFFFFFICHSLLSELLWLNNICLALTDNRSFIYSKLMVFIWRTNVFQFLIIKQKRKHSQNVRFKRKCF